MQDVRHRAERNLRLSFDTGVVQYGIIDLISEDGYEEKDTGRKT